MAKFPCIYTFKGKDYTVEEFMSKMMDGSLDDYINPYLKSEIKTPEERLSGIKKSTVPSDKIESIPIEKMSNKEVYSKGKELVDNGDISPEDIILEFKSKPRALQPNEVASLVYYKGKLDNRFDKISEEFNKAKESGDVDAQVLAKNKMDAINSELDDYHNMSVKSAYEQSLAFRLRQMLVDSEYNLKSQELKYKAVNKGVIPQEVQDRFKKYDEELNEVNKKIRDLEAKRAEDAELIKSLNAEKEAEEAIRESKKQARNSTKEKLKSERKVIVDNIKNKLRKARSGESGLTAVPIPFAKELVAISPDVAKLMRNYAQEGVVHLDEFVDKIHDDLKDILEGITKRDVRDLIAGNYKQPRTKNEIVKSLSEVRKKAKLISRLEELKEGKSEYKTPKEKKKSSEEIESIRRQIGEHNITRINTLKKRYEGEIKRYEEKLSKGDFGKKEKEELDYDKKLRELEVEREKVKEKFDIEQEKARVQNRTIKERVTEGFVDVMNLPKSLMASADLSAPLRQGIILSTRHPILASKSFIEMMKQAFSSKKVDDWFHELKTSPEYGDIQKSDLYISEPSAKLKAKDEQFVSNIAKKIPGWGKIVEGSERAYSAFLNKIRVDSFVDFKNQLEKDGFSGKELNEELKNYADFINNATARGHLGKFEEAAPLLNSVFFSPRYVVSRFNLINPSKYVQMSPRARKEALKSVGSFIGTGMATLALAKASGADVEIDPRSPDFGKIVIGNTRYDIWAGFAQTARLLAQVASGEKKTLDGDIKNLGEGYNSSSRLDVLGRFGRSKLSPSAGTAANILQGKDFSGKPISIKDELLKLAVPLYLSDIKSTYEKGGLKDVATEGIPAFFGVGVQKYDSKEKTPSNYKEKYFDADTKQNIKNKINNIKSELPEKTRIAKERISRFKMNRDASKNN